MAKKTTKKTVQKRRALLPEVILLSSILIIVGLLIVFVTAYALPKLHAQQRVARINDIYKSLDLGQNYIVQNSNVFGDKRVYEWDKSRTYASSEEFVRAANVDTTVAEMKAAVAKTNFTFHEEPYPGSLQWQYIYKSPQNEYLRISVSSKLRDDAFFNDFHMDGKFSDATFAIDPNAGPSNVTIKVNLDDNNE